MATISPKIEIIEKITAIFICKSINVIIGPMAKCSLCEKGSRVGRNRSHAQNRSPRRFGANIQKVTMKLGEEKISGSFCTKCIKKLRGEIAAAKETI
jgi:ribosomal protein L28